MAVAKSQRIIIWVIAIFMTLGTLGSFLAMGLTMKNSEADTARYQAAYEEYSAAVTKQTTELSDQYYPIFSQYASEVSAFDASSVTELKTTDLLVGDGEEVTADSEYSAYYIGWNPKGTIFDQSVSNGALSAPISGGSMIDGWEQGIVGMKFGGVRELSIPSDLAYGSTGSGENIPADTPIKFVVMIIPKINEVEIPAALLEYYSSQN